MKAHKQMTRDEALSIVNTIAHIHPTPPTPVPIADNAEKTPSKLTLSESLDLVEKRIAVLNGWLTELENSAAELNARI